MPLNMRIGPLVAVSALAITVAGNPVTGWSGGGGGGGASPASPGPGSPTITINIAETVGPLVAPCGVKFRFTFTGAALTKPTDPLALDPTFRGLHYCTSWGDPGQFRNAHVMHSSHRDRNISYAPDPCHVYATPGTYIANVYIFDDQGNWGTAQRTYTIEAQDAFFTADETILCAPDGVFDAPVTVPVANRFTTDSGLAARINTLLTTGRQRCLVRYKGGQTFNITSVIEPTTAGAILGEASFGTGKGQVIYGNTGADFQFGGRGVAGFVDSIRFMTDYDEITESGAVRRRWNNRARAGTVYTTHNCDYDDWSLFYYPSEVFGTGKAEVAFSDCEFRGGKTFMSLGGVEAVSLNLYGCKGVQSPGASNGWMEEWGSASGRFPGNDSGGLRGSGDLTMEGCSFYVKGNWAFGGPLLNGNKVDGAVMRWGGGQDGTERVYLGRSYFEGAVSSEQANGGALPHNMLVDKSTFVCTPANFSGLWNISKGGTFGRSCIMIVPNHVRTGTSSGPISNLTEPGSNGIFGGTGSANAARPVGMVNFTVVDLRQQSRQPGSTTLTGGLSGYATVIDAQNVIYAPNKTVPEAPAGGITPVNAGIEALYDGARLSWAGLTHTLTGSVADGATVDLPYPTDYFGNVTNQASFVGTNNQHALEVNGVSPRYIPQAVGDLTDGSTVVVRGSRLTVQFLPGAVRVTNQTGAAWSSGTVLRLRLDRGSSLMALDTTYAQPAGSLVLPYPTAVTPVGAGERCFDDFTCRLRPGSGRANAPSGTDCRGALLPQAA